MPGNGEPPVVVLMFDMMGYGTLFGDGGQVVPACTNFAAFCGRADVYHGAESAGGQTATSLPGFTDLRHVLPDLPLFAGPPRTEQAGE